MMTAAMWILSSGFSLALTPDQVLVVENARSRVGVSLAHYYMKKRAIPSDNLIKVKVTTKERCSREQFKKGVLRPIKRFLSREDSSGKIRCLVTVYGVPLVVNPGEMTKKEKAEVESKERQLRSNREALSYARKMEKGRQSIKSLQKEIKRLQNEIRKIRKTDQLASVDSELSLARFDRYRIEGWLPNPYFVGYANKKLNSLKDRVLMVSRLDGPDYKTVKRIIDDSVRIEEEGLHGIAYFDARYPKIKKPSSAYGWYDLSIRKAADYVKKSDTLKVVLDTKPELFKPGSCPDAALYCGWYSLAKYIDAFSWAPGSVGYHIASSECASLKNKKASYWCIQMLEKGVAATLGPVAEPYVRAFPPPGLFFRYILEGKCLVEAYFLSKPFLSWRMVLVGDPLYRPFKHKR